MEIVELKIQGISYSDNTSGAFALILQETNGSRKLPIVIGGFEAQAIAIGLENKIKTSNLGFVVSMGEILKVLISALELD